MKLKTLFIILYSLNLFVLTLVIIFLLEYKSAYSNMEQTYISKNHSFLLADELRQSSDDLTRLARTYVITLNSRFEKQYHKVLAIRNGTRPRPTNYNRIYWDFLAVDGIVEEQNKNFQSIALRTLMENAGFTTQELDLLTQSQLQSDTLVHLEEIAMHAVVGLFEDEKGNYTINKAADSKLAREIMHSDAYHQSKISIMNPLNKFFQLFEYRTNLTIEKSKIYLNKVESFLATIVVFFILIMVTSIVIMVKRFIRPLIDLKKSMWGLSNNDLHTNIPPITHDDEVGEMIGAVRIFKENTQNLIISERRFKLLLDSIGEGVFGLNKQKKFSFINPSACDFLGFTSEELLSLSLQPIMYEDGINDISEKLIGRKQSMGEIQLQRKDKTHFYAEYVATPIIDKDNIAEGYVVVFSDITERKINEDLLLKAKDSAEAANRAKSLFLANMSHELRTPLNAILGFTQLLLKDERLESQQKENLDIIHNSGKHLLNLISEILEVAKLQAGKIEITNSSLNFHVFLENILFIFSSRAKEKGVAFYTNDFKFLPQFIIGDEQRLRQVLFNLLSNALKFTQTGSITLNVTYENNQLNFDVIDTGNGILEEELQLVFKPFEQAKSSKDQKTGTGLGLTITQELVTLMGGKISVSSTLGVGTKFSVKLYIPESLNAEIIEKVAKSNRVLADKYMQKFKVLIVDDIYENRLLIVQIVQYLGFQTCEAENGLLALEKFKEEKPDIIFMDIQMPVLDGYEAIKRIRSGSENSKIPIILISANVFEEEKEKALEQGANAFIGKPISESDVIFTLETFLELEFIPKAKNTPFDIFSKDLLLHITPEDKALIIKAAQDLNTTQTLSILMKYEATNLNSVTYLRQKTNDYQFNELISFFS
ncbi:MAG: PAS domain S-box-containing protein [Sulfurimonas sp.]|jgi:PAS domain S-box-containing protein|uniref:ATP-binding protein n=1 Tax=Sulfurimonas sp. TaxID=2022749 RepID=UPI0039E2CA43